MGTSGLKNVKVAGNDNSVIGDMSTSIPFRMG